MAETTDRYFLRPRELLSATRINLIDAINLVVYADLPLVSAFRGKKLIVGYLRREALGNFQLLGPSGADDLIRKYATYIDCLSYPVGPTHYEPLLDAMCIANESVLPYFFHEHHLMVDRRRRAAMFMRTYQEFWEEIENKDVIIKFPKSDKTAFLPLGGSMTQAELQDYLFFRGVLEWWQDEENVKSHGYLERVIPSDALAMTLGGTPPGTTESPSSDFRHRYRPWGQNAWAGPEHEIYDELQLPSLLLAQKLLKKSSFRPEERQPTPISYMSQDFQINLIDVGTHHSNWVDRNGAIAASGYREATHEPQDDVTLPPYRESRSEFAATHDTPQKRSETELVLNIPADEPTHKPSPTGEPRDEKSLETPPSRMGRRSSHAIAKEAQENSQNSKTNIPSEDDTMLSRQGVANLLGLDHANSTDNYQKRFPDFPKPHPVTKKRSKRAVLDWLEANKNG